ncbi:MAG: hypothetical protein WBZ29_00425 [Methanocella sp.]
MPQPHLYTLLKGGLIALLLTLVVVCMTDGVLAAPGMEWYDLFGADSTGIEGTDVVATADGGYVLGGLRHVYTDLQSGQPYYVNPILIKTDNAGKLQWAKFYGNHVKVGWPLRIRQTSDNGFVMLANAPEGGSSDFILIRVDSNGNFLWDRSYTTSGDAYIVEPTKDGAYMIFAGETIQPHVIHPALVKVDANGDVEWRKVYNETPLVMMIPMSPISGQVAPDGGYVLAAANDSGILLYRTDASGSLQWLKKYCDPGNVPLSLSVTPDGGYMILAKDEARVWLIKTDSDGTIQWDKRYDEFKLASGRQLTGGYVINTENRVFMLDNAGNILWQWGLADINITMPPFPGNQMAEFGIASLCRGVDGGLVLAGKYKYNDYTGFDYNSTDFTSAVRNNDALIIKIYNDTAGNAAINRSNRQLIDSLGKNAGGQSIQASPGFGTEVIVIALLLVLAMMYRRYRD